MHGFFPVFRFGAPKCNNILELHDVRRSSCAFSDIDVTRVELIRCLCRVRILVELIPFQLAKIIEVFSVNDFDRLLVRLAFPRSQEECDCGQCDTYPLREPWRNFQLGIEGRSDKIRE